MELQVGVKVLLKNPEGKYLLVLRNPQKYTEVPSNWDLVGGRITPGAKLLDNLKREVKEEVNLDLADEPQLVGAQDILRIPGRHIVRLSFTANIQGEPKLSEEHIQYGWFTMAEIQTMDLDIYFRDLLDKGLIHG